MRTVPIRFRKPPTIVAAAIGISAMLSARAFAAGSGMPWEEPLQKVLESVQGPVAKIVAVMIIIVTGLTLAFGADKVDFHTWSLLKGVALSTLLGVGSSLTFTGESDLVRAIRESSQQNASRAGDQFTSRNLQVQPTITVRPGAPVRLVVHRDLILAPWRG